MLAFCVGGHRRTMAANERRRSMSRKFFLLRWIDNLRVPTPRNETTLERSGRVKDIIFADNATNERMKELLLHAFSDHLDADDLPSLYFYKTVGTTTRLQEVCSGVTVCGPTLKSRFKTATRIYMRKNIGGDASASGQSGRDEGSSTVDRADNEDMDLTAPGAADDAQSAPGPSGENNERVDYPLAIPGTSGTSRNTGIVHTVDSSDEDNVLPPLYHSTPERSNQHLPGPNTLADSITCTMYDGIVKTAILSYPCNEQASWERDAVQVGEINEEPNNLYGAELDTCSYGSSFDWRIMEELLHLNGVTARILPLCLAPSQVRLQSHYDSTPVCILRYRPTKEAAKILRELMSECTNVLSQCHKHVALIGSQFDKEGDDLTVNVRRAIGEAIVAAQAVRCQREVIVEARGLRERQDIEARASEMADRTHGQKRKFPTIEKGAEEKEDDDDEQESLEATIVDTEEQGLREPNDDQDANDSGTVTVRTT